MKNFRTVFILTTLAACMSFANQPSTTDTSATTPLDSSMDDTTSSELDTTLDTTTSRTVASPMASDLGTKLKADASSGFAFDPGRTTLTSEETRALDEIVSQARQNGQKIDEVRVLVWADKDIPASAGRAATKSDMKLADERARNIKSYLQKNLKVSDVETFNLARRPTALQDLYRAQGLAITPNSEAAMSAAQPMASEAVVLVYKK